MGDGPHGRDGRSFGAHLVAIDEAGATDRQLHGATVKPTAVLSTDGWENHGQTPCK